MKYSFIEGKSYSELQTQTYTELESNVIKIYPLVLINSEVTTLLTPQKITLLPITTNITSNINLTINYIKRIVTSVSISATTICSSSGGIPLYKSISISGNCVVNAISRVNLVASVNIISNTIITSVAVKRIYSNTNITTISNQVFNLVLKKFITTTNINSNVNIVANSYVRLTRSCDIRVLSSTNFSNSKNTINNIVNINLIIPNRVYKDMIINNEYLITQKVNKIEQANLIINRSTNNDIKIIKLFDIQLKTVEVK